jgi:pimeloyl-ACP methyl ester carboxylesterase
MTIDDSGLLNIIRSEKAEDLYVIFSHIGFPRGKFSQSNLLSDARVDRIHVNAVDNDWYQRDIDRTAARLAQSASSLGSKRITCAGSSMGAYAALLFGCLLDAHRIIAIAPEIRIGEPWQRSFMLNQSRSFDPRYANLHDAIATASGVEIYVAGYDLVDLGGFDERILGHEGSTVAFLSGDHKVSERVDWRRLYAGERHIGVHRLAEVPRNMHEYAKIKHAEYDGRRDEALNLLLSRCEWSSFAPDFYFAALDLTARDKQGAMRLLERALALDPHCVEAHHHFGLCLKAQNRIDEAVAHFRSAISINEAAAPSRFRLAEALSLQGKEEEAVPHLGRALSLDPKNSAYRALASRLLGADASATERSCAP